nr:MAG TPA: hypothetical protein [Caudoviricetes sp.]
MPPPSTGIEGIVLVVDRLGLKTAVPIGAVVGQQENFYCDRKAVNRQGRRNGRQHPPCGNPEQEVGRHRTQQTNGDDLQLLPHVDLLVIEQPGRQCDALFHEQPDQHGQCREAAERDKAVIYDLHLSSLIFSNGYFIDPRFLLIRPSCSAFSSAEASHHRPGASSGILIRRFTKSRSSSVTSAAWVR